MQLNELLSHFKQMYSNKIKYLLKEMANFKKNNSNQFSAKEKLSLNNLTKSITEQIQKQNEKIKFLNDKMNKIKNGLIDLMTHRVNKTPV